MSRALSQWEYDLTALGTLYTQLMFLSGSYERRFLKHALRPAGAPSSPHSGAPCYYITVLRAYTISVLIA